MSSQTAAACDNGAPWRSDRVSSRSDLCTTVTPTAERSSCACLLSEASAERPSRAGVGTLASALPRSSLALPDGLCLRRVYEARSEGALATAKLSCTTLDGCPSA